MHHTKLNIWVQLGGHCDGDFNPLAVAMKEASEESGLSSIVAVHEDIFDIDIHFIPEIQNQKPHYHYDVRFLLKVDNNDEIQANHECELLAIKIASFLLLLMITRRPENIFLFRCHSIIHRR